MALSTVSGILTRVGMGRQFSPSKSWVTIRAPDCDPIPLVPADPQ
jgi:hypothetical protein